MVSFIFSSEIIRKLIAYFILVVFVLVITPKKTLHTLLTNHRDNISKSSAGKTQQIGKPGFNCKCDNLAAESNFIDGKGFIITAPASFHSGFSLYYSSFLSFPQLLFNLRGPPVKFLIANISVLKPAVKFSSAIKHL